MRAIEQKLGLLTGRAGGFCALARAKEVLELGASELPRPTRGEVLSRGKASSGRYLSDYVIPCFAKSAVFYPAPFRELPALFFFSVNDVAVMQVGQVLRVKNLALLHVVVGGR